ncbi:response regulator transcription factor [Guggenheimella bovis]
MKEKILFAEDDERYRFMVGNFLDKNGYDVTFASNGEEAIDLFFENPHFDLVLLDIMMPVMTGLEAAKIIREKSDVPIIFLTALGDENSEIEGLRIGADDYITKPFSYPVFQSRIAANLRRKRLTEEQVLKQGDLMVNIDKRTVSIAGKEVDLTPNEYQLLVYFMKNEGVALSRDQIIDSVWGMAFEGDGRNVDTHVKRLRSKLGDYGAMIKTIYGYGYRWEAVS